MITEPYTRDDLILVFWITYISGVIVGGIVIPIAVKMLKKIWGRR